MITLDPTSIAIGFWLLCGLKLNFDLWTARGRPPWLNPTTGQTGGWIFALLFTLVLFIGGPLFTLAFYLLGDD